MTARARFVVHEDRDGDPLIIRDVGPWCNHPTVTNDVEAVVDQLLSDGILVYGRRLFYIDSEGTLDEIVIRDGRFDGFLPGPCT